MELTDSGHLRLSRERGTEDVWYARLAPVGASVDGALDGSLSTKVSVVPNATGSAQASVNPKDAYGDAKPDISLVPPVAIIKEARVMQLGAKKYGPYNWREKRCRLLVYTAAAMRHIMQWQDGEEFDSESGESHLAHARACLGIILDAQSIGNVDDNRPKKGAAGKEIRREQGTNQTQQQMDNRQGKVSGDGPSPLFAHRDA